MRLKPYMPQSEIALFDTFLALKRPARVLEYGAGGSTVRWSAFPSVQRWLTIEHDLTWAQRAAAACQQAATCAEIRRVDAETAGGYVMAPAGEAPFDLIFVDGRHRVECVKQSAQLLAPHGIVVLHDIWQNDHAEALDTYPHQTILGDPDRQHNGFLVMWGEP